MVPFVRERGAEDISDEKMLRRILIEQRDKTLPFLDKMTAEQKSVLLGALGLTEDQLRNSKEDVESALGYLEDESAAEIYKHMCEWLGIKYEED